MKLRCVAVAAAAVLAAVLSGPARCSAQGGGTPLNQQPTQLKPDQWAYFGYVAYGGRLLVDTHVVAVGFQGIPHAGNSFEFDGTHKTFPVSSGGYNSFGTGPMKLTIRTAGANKNGTVISNMIVQAGSQRHHLVFEEKGPTLTINKRHKFDLSGEKMLIVVTADGTAKKSTKATVNKGSFAVAKQAHQMQLKMVPGGIF